MGSRELGINIDGGDSLSYRRQKHPLNQRQSKETNEGRKRRFGPIDKALKAALREERIERSRREFEEQNALGVQSQFGPNRTIIHGVQHGLQYLLGVNMTQQCVEEILGKEEIIDRFNTPSGNHFTITIVDFASTKFEKVA